ncbi:WXG100 family type VII secretion target [Paenibacillus sp. M-152]|uniref:WXG100 family type VII secretion target n=1 Tax=Paenibacillus sp. M-152 TaxID=2487928 RepID=UPI000F6D98D0|nr:WXG100 family type VII secretion target [Paenibacillus sp. M-152]AZH30761.1 WXG100 family type VII secretion target [Paenibacillus sp. M-152]
MGRILVRPDKLMEVADQFLHGKHEMERMLNFLSGRIDFVQQGWSGATQERFFQEFQVSRQSMNVTIERLSTVAQELIFISKNFTQVDGEKVVLDVPWLGTPVKTASTGESWLHKIFEQIGQAEITKAEAQLEASKLQGEILWDTAQGAKGAIQGNLTLGMLPDKERDYDHPMAAKVGEILGNVATTLQGAGEVVAGIGGEGLSVAVSSTGVGSIVGVPGLIGSAALAAHGATTAVKSANGVGEKTAELWQMVKGEGGGKNSRPSSSTVHHEVTSQSPSTIKNPKEVEIVNKKGESIGEFDEIDLKKKIFYEDKSAKGLDKVNPKTGLPAQTPQEFTDKQLLKKTRNRINELENNAFTTRATKNSSSDIPHLDSIKDIREFVFRLDGDTPELRKAAENSLNQLKKEFPDYKFSVQFGGGK